MIFLINSLIVSVIILGYHLLMDFLISDWFNLSLSDIYDKYSGKWQLYFLKPLLLCPVCMTSIWGIGLYFLFYEDVTYLFFHIGAVGLFNYLISKHFL